MPGVLTGWAPALLERDAELAAVEALVDGAAVGHGGVALIAGEAGIGKTALVRAAIARARQRDVRVLSVRLEEHDGAIAFGVVRDLLAAHLTPEEPGGIAGPARQALAVLRGEPGPDPPRGAGDVEAGVVHACTG